MLTIMEGKLAPPLKFYFNPLFRNTFEIMQGHFVVSKLKTDQDSSYILRREYFSMRGCVNLPSLPEGEKKWKLRNILQRNIPFRVYRGNVTIICDESIPRFVAIFISSRHIIRPASLAVTFGLIDIFRTPLVGLLLSAMPALLGRPYRSNYSRS